MSLRDAVLADARGFAACDELTEAATLSPVGLSAFALAGVFGGAAPRQAGAVAPSVQGDGATATFRVLDAEALRAAMLAASGVSRLPGEGDVLTLRGEEWSVTSARLTATGGALLQISTTRATALGPAWGAA